MDEQTLQNTAPETSVPVEGGDALQPAPTAVTPAENNVLQAPAEGVRVLPEQSMPVSVGNAEPAQAVQPVLPQAPAAPVPASVPRNFMGELLSKAQDKLRQRKEKKLQKILVLARDRGRIENHDVRKLLHCSDATATRYLQELEKQGRVIQDSRRGGASYRFLG